MNFPYVGFVFLEQIIIYGFNYHFGSRNCSHRAKHDLIRTENQSDRAIVKWKIQPIDIHTYVYISKFYYIKLNSIF